jgi:chromosome segregation ATPase
MKWLKEALFEQTPDFEKKETPPPVPGTPKLPSTPSMLMSQPVGFASTSIPNNTVAVPVTAGVNAQLKQELLTDLTTNVDPKYVQFKTMANSMASVITDTKQRLNAAYAAVKATGTSKTELIGAPAKILEVLKSKRNEVSSIANQQMDQISKAAEQQSANYANTIAQKQQQIQALNSEIERIKSEQQSVLSQVNAQRTEIDTAHAQFVATAMDIEKDLSTEINDLTTYIME